MYSVVLMAALTTAPEAPGCWIKCGCHGGCYGGCYSCGGCYGCGGCSGWGCAGCYGGCWSPGYSNIYAVSPWNAFAMAYGGYGFYGCGCTCFGTPYIAKPTPPAPAGKPAEEIPPPKKGEGAPGAAKLTIELPEGAKLFVDNQPIQATGTRTFNTPRLELGQSYYYMIKVEVVRDGKTISDTKQVIVRAGQTAKADFLALGKTDPNKAVARAGE